MMGGRMGDDWGGFGGDGMADGCGLILSLNSCTLRTTKHAERSRPDHVHDDRCASKISD